MRCYICGQKRENFLGHLPIEKIRQKACPGTPVRIYDLGSGDKTEDEAVAVDKFMAREYPNLLNDKSSSAIFIPECFLSQYPKAVEYEATDVHSEMKPSDFNATQVKGEKSENHMFQQLMQVLDKAKNLVVFHSYNWVTESAEKQEGEMDFLIVSLRTQKIINIECKSNLNKPKLNKALKQFERHYNYIKSTLSFGSGWLFVRVLSFTEDIRDLCHTCKKYFIGHSSTFADVWDNILALQSGTKITPELTDEYYTIVSQLAFKQSVNFPTNPGAKKSVFNKKLQDKLNSISDPVNIILWTRGQLKVLKDETQTKVLLRSYFGTGKTVLLKAKAFETAKNNRDKLVFYITCPMRAEVGNAKQLYREEVRLFAKEQDNLQVLSWFDLEEKVRKSVQKDEEWFKDKEKVFKMFVDIHLNKMAGIFMDEFLCDFFFRINANYYNTQTLQTMRYLLKSFSEDEHSQFYDDVANYIESNSELLNLIKKKFAGNCEMQAFISGSQSIVVNNRNKDSLSSFLSRFLEVLHLTCRARNRKFQIKMQKMFHGLEAIVKRHFCPKSKPQFSGHSAFQLTLHVVHLLKHLSSLKDYNGLIWIAANSEDVFWSNRRLTQDTTGFCFPTLEYNMRNVYSIAGHVSSTFKSKGIECKKHSNAILGKEPIVTNVIENRMNSNYEHDANVLFGEFKIALKNLDNDTNDLLVVVNDLLYASEEGCFESLFSLIQEYCQEQQIPCYNCFGEKQSEKDMETFLTYDRKGIVIGDMVSVQGFEFKSVIFYNEDDDKWHFPDPGSVNTSSAASVMFRARINLYEIRLIHFFWLNDDHEF